MLQKRAARLLSNEERGKKKGKNGKIDAVAVSSFALRLMLIRIHRVHISSFCTRGDEERGGEKEKKKRRVDQMVC